MEFIRRMIALAIDGIVAVAAFPIWVYIFLRETHKCQYRQAHAAENARHLCKLLKSGDKAAAEAFWEEITQ